MSEVVIRVENLYKEYRLGTISHGTLYRDMQSWWANLRGKEDPNSLVSSSYSEKATDTNKRFYALKDVSFDVKQGEIVGIIGRNGAGKSTLLKVLSKVTAPTKGTVKVKGRIASLLEVGTGFHPELTGRENIYLNGTILGMKRKEIDEKFKEIVDFAEIEEFVDTPVKRYSSGMYVRLAFAVAAHLDPEILLVDEVLAVGDVAFQKKCLGKMGEIAEGGRTVLFVSHNMPSIENLCERVIWINQGIVVKSGEARKVVADYIDESNRYLETRKIGEYQNLGHRRGSGEIQFTDFRLLNSKGVKIREFIMGETIRMEVDFHVFKDVENAVFAFGLVDSLTQVFLTNWIGRQKSQSLRTSQQGTFYVELPDNPLRARKYHFYLGVIGSNDIPYDIWDGVGTEFIMKYPDDVNSLEFNVGRDVALATLPLIVDIKKKQS